MPKLTKKVVDAAAPSGRDTFLWDGEMAGFGLRVFASGKKSYLVQYRAGGRLRRYTIGPHGVFTPDEARKDARILLADVERGLDPAERRAEQRRDLTMAELCDLYVAEGMTTKKPTTIVSDKGKLERHVKPLLGKRQLRSIGRGEIERFQADVASGKTAIDVKRGFRGRSRVTGGKGTATRTLGLLSGVFQFAVNRGLRPDNPVRGVKRFPERKMERFLSPAEMARLGKAFSDMADEAVNGVAISALRLLALTGCRRSEVTGLRWSWIDWERACIRFPDSKTGAKVVPLGAAALALLSELRDARTNSSFVFPGRGKEGTTTAAWKVWEKVRKRAGLPDVRIHDLRHSFASVGASGGDSLVVIGALLGHRDTGTTARYAHLSNDPLKAAADRIAGNIASAMEGKAAKVVALCGRRRKASG
jgi:integrase